MGYKIWDLLRGDHATFSCFLRIGSHSQGGFQLLTLLPSPAKSWNYKHVSSFSSFWLLSTSPHTTLRRWLHLPPSSRFPLLSLESCIKKSAWHLGNTNIFGTVSRGPCWKLSMSWQRVAVWDIDPWDASCQEPFSRYFSHNMSYCTFQFRDNISNSFIICDFWLTSEILFLIASR